LTPEQKASEAVRLRAAAWGVKLMRNNSGVLPDVTGRPVRFGLGNESKRINEKLKSGDYVGWTPVTITPEMVGKTIAVFTNIEVKAKGFKQREHYVEKSREFAQNKFNKLVLSTNGCAGFASCAADVDRIINTLLEGLKE